MTEAVTGGSVWLNIDAYGTYARQSALADYVEVAALRGSRVTEADLARAVEENGWARLSRRQFLTVDNVDEDPEAWAQSTYGLLRERAQVLADLYPFELGKKSIRTTVTSSEAQHSSYVCLLAIAVLHAWQLVAPDGPRPDDALEDLVARALENRGLRVSRMGAHDRATRSFVEAVVQGGKFLGLEPMPDPLPRKASAKDAGVDTLAGLTWIDGRPGGQWLFIGQATVGQSGTWEAKLSEPAPAIWADYMQEPLDPFAFLAVPHHIQSEHLEHLTKSRRGLVLDRLRLCRYAAPTSTAEQHLTSQLFAAGIE